MTSTSSMVNVLVEHSFILPTTIFVFVLSSTDSKSLPELPNEQDDFESLRAQNKVFVDKSGYLLELLKSENRLFRMCRPGRFGKSTFLQMMKAFFEGRKELFEGLEIYDQHDWRKSNPVIFLDLSAIINAGNLKSIGSWLELEILRIGKLYDVEIDEELGQNYDANFRYDERAGRRLNQLLDGLTKGGQKIVLLIDEYDKPMRIDEYHSFGDTHESGAWFGNAIMYRFFSQIERRVDAFEFMFLTCTVAHPLRVAYLQHELGTLPEPIPLKDISYDPQFSRMMGLTNDELQTHMKSHINATMMINCPNETSRNFVQKLRKRYNGYCFSRDDAANTSSECRFFNFHSVISCLRNNDLDYVWYPTGNWSNVLEDGRHVLSTTNFYLTRHWNFFKPKSLIVPRASLEPKLYYEHRFYDTRRQLLADCMLPFGFVTLQGYKKQTDEFVVHFPNEEMRELYVQTALEHIFNRRPLSKSEFFRQCNSLRESMLAGRVEESFERLHEIIRKPIAHNDAIDLIYQVFRICHFSLSEILGNGSRGTKVDHLIYQEKVISKKITKHNKARFDGLEVTLSEHIAYRFKFEFKSSATNAMNVALGAVNEESFREASRNRTTHLIGINVNEEGHWIDDWMKMTYFDGKLGDVQGSHPQYVDMYRTFVELKPYSPLTSIPTRAYRRVE